jgi:hypothetical protein
MSLIGCSVWGDEEVTKMVCAVSECGGVLRDVAAVHRQPSGAGAGRETPHYDVVGPWLVINVST